MTKALLVQELPNGKIAVIAVEPAEVIPTVNILNVVNTPGFEYPSADNLYGVIRDYFKPPTDPIPPVNLA